MGRSTTRSGGALAARCDHDQVGDPGCTPARAAAAPARLRDRRDSQHHYQVGAKVPRSHGAETTSACASARVSVFLGSFRLRSAPLPCLRLGFLRGLSVLPLTRCRAPPVVDSVLLRPPCLLTSSPTSILSPRCYLSPDAIDTPPPSRARLASAAPLLSPLSSPHASVAWPLPLSTSDPSRCPLHPRSDQVSASSTRPTDATRPSAAAPPSRSTSTDPHSTPSQ
jgi:hypothetical protein